MASTTDPANMVESDGSAAARTAWPRALAAVGAINGALAVIGGAFAAHALSGDDRAVHLATTAADYQMAHALVLVAIGLLPDRVRPALAKPAAGCFLFGIVAFSGALYLLALGGPRVLGAVAPVGGTAFIFAWGLLAAAVWTGPRETQP